MAKTRHVAANSAAHSGETDVQSVWEEFKKKPTRQLRNRLLQHYLPLVKYTSERIHSKLPDEIEIDDLMSAGIFGLMDAIDAFDLGRGFKFETYCAPRIRGAILDELRAMDWVPRLVRSRSAQVESARKSIEMAAGRAATDDEICTKLNISKEEFDKIKKDVGAVGVVSLSQKYYETDSNKDVREIDVLVDTRQTNPLAAMQRRDLKEMIVKGLTRAERLIVMLYYFEEMTMKEIGATLDLSESRVSQMHSSILARLKAQFQHRSGELSQSIE